MGSRGSLTFNFLRNLHTIYQKWLHQFTCPPTVHKGFLFSTSSPTLISSLLMIAILTSVKQYLIVVLICIFLMMKDTSLFFMPLWPSGEMLFFGKIFVQILYFKKIKLFEVVSHCMSCLYILVLVYKYFLLFSRFPFWFVDGFFCHTKAFSLI